MISIKQVLIPATSSHSLTGSFLNHCQKITTDFDIFFLVLFTLFSRYIYCNVSLLYFRVMAAALSLTFGRGGALMGNLIFGFLIDLNCVVPIVLFASMLFGEYYSLPIEIYEYVIVRYLNFIIHMDTYFNVQLYSIVQQCRVVEYRINIIQDRVNTEICIKPRDKIQKKTSRKNEKITVLEFVPQNSNLSCKEIKCITKRTVAFRIPRNIDYNLIRL